MAKKKGDGSDGLGYSIPPDGHYNPVSPADRAALVAAALGAIVAKTDDLNRMTGPEAFDNMGRLAVRIADAAAKAMGEDK